MAGLPIQPPSQPQMVRGPHFTYQLPAGWTVGEEGNFALVLRSPDWLAGIVVFGQSGLMMPLSPEQFAHHSMTNVMRLAPDVRFFNSRPIAPMPGYSHAAIFETTYTVHAPQGPVSIQGVVIGNVAHGYGECSGTFTIASSDVRQWQHYASWLPQVASYAVNTGPNPYGRQTMAGVISGIAQQDHARARSHQEWSQQTWQQVTDARNSSIDRQQGAMDNMLTGQQWMQEGFGGYDIRRSTTPACRWRSRDGREMTSPDPSFDPRTPTDSDWVRVQ